MSSATCSCPNCGHQAELDAQYVGTAVQCPNCAHEMRIVAPYYVTCRCQHCEGKIEFDARELGDENNIVPCPHCGLETKLYKQATHLPYSEAAWQRSLPATRAQKEKLGFLGCTWNGAITFGQAADAILECAVRYPYMEAAWRTWKRRKGELANESAFQEVTIQEARKSGNTDEVELAKTTHAQLAVPQIKPTAPSSFGLPPRREGFFAGDPEPSNISRQNGSSTQPATLKVVPKPGIQRQIPKPCPACGYVHCICAEGGPLRRTGIIPARQSFTLDMVKVEAIKNETKEVVAILSEAMQDEHDKNITPPKALDVAVREIPNISSDGTSESRPPRVGGRDESPMRSVTTQQSGQPQHGSSQGSGTGRSSERSSIVPVACPVCGWSKCCCATSARPLSATATPGDCCPDRQTLYQRGLPATEIQKEKLGYYGSNCDGPLTFGQAEDKLAECAKRFPLLESDWENRLKTKRNLHELPKALQKPSGQPSFAKEQPNIPLTLTLTESEILRDIVRDSREEICVNPADSHRTGRIPAPHIFPLDMVRGDAIRTETKDVPGIFSELTQDEVEKIIRPPKAVGVPGPVIPTISMESISATLPARFSGLDVTFHPVLQRLLTRDSWPRADFDSLAREFHLMPLAVLDMVNEWADTSLGDFIFEGEDPVKVRGELIPKELI